LPSCQVIYHAECGPGHLAGPWVSELTQPLVRLEYSLDTTRTLSQKENQTCRYPRDAPKQSLLTTAVRSPQPTHNDTYAGANTGWSRDRVAAPPALGTSPPTVSAGER
jgi:hypothetical protein